MSLFIPSQKKKKSLQYFAMINGPEWTIIHIFWYTRVNISYEFPRSELAGSKGKYIKIFDTYCQIALKKDYIHLYFYL